MSTNSNVYWMEVPAGKFLVQWTGFLLKSVQWVGKNDFPQGTFRLLSFDELPTFWKEWIQQLEAFFRSGEPMGELPWDQMDRSDWTPFQESVYRTIAKIPHGETRTYAWVAARAGKYSATRAVGQALKRNPIPVLIPCHRVITSNGSLGGFMGVNRPNEPELHLKQSLLNLEGDYRNPIFPFLTSSTVGATA